MCLNRASRNSPLDTYLTRSKTAQFAEIHRLGKAFCQSAPMVAECEEPWWFIAICEKKDDLTRQIKHINN
jgi:hypothetical protein